MLNFYANFKVHTNVNVKAHLRLVHTDFHRRVNVTNATLTGKIGTQPILPITVTVRKIKGAARQNYVESDVDVTVTLGVNRALHQASASTQSQRCDDTIDTALIEINGSK